MKKSQSIPGKEISCSTSCSERIPKEIWRIRAIAAMVTAVLILVLTILTNAVKMSQEIITAAMMTTTSIGIDGRENFTG
ncbi:DUF2116 family Zn-ribbon domain-containing protein [[Leptolyngbya] sp. PCC 7376]|uniref:DUF2116 family Zn-ribbon domain-containing protein n=1 Tax=[Leptolyngbya] sp. PCC 7376 TaxID=111781 RepID=UPI0009006F78